jgi:hypothetical protein
MNPETLSLFLYQRTVVKKDKTKYTALKASFEDVTFDAYLTKATNEKLTALMVTKNLTFPMTLTVSDSMYFTKPKKFMDSKGEQHYKDILIIKDFVSVEQAEFRKKASLHDLAEAIKAGRAEMDDEEIEEEE